VPDAPPSSAVQARAAYWNPKLWSFPTKTIVRPFVSEQFGGRWMTFKAAWHPGASGPKTYMATEAYRLASAQPAPAAPPPAAPPPAIPTAPLPPLAPLPAPVPPPPPVAPPPPQGPPPGPVSPYPGTGAWQTNGPYVHRYQAALAWLAGQGNPSWNPGAIDGKYGPNTQRAVKAFQASHGLAQDGEAGSQTAAALDAAMGLGAPAAPPAAPAMPAPVAQPVQPPSGPPGLVGPYPGTGAWKGNKPYIGRYQNALTWLSLTGGHPAWNPQGVDGTYGPHTAAAVKAFQGDTNLPVDGEAGPTTAAALDHLLQGGGSA
jgi:peptidoglycan hydrolase-like protein with peptidoglycan-binding domain